jgi:hypothetical protein
MSEHLHHPENKEQQIPIELHDHYQEKEAKRLEAAAEKLKNQPEDHLEHIRKRAQEHAESAYKLKIINEQSKRYQPAQSYVNREIKNMAYQRLLTRARKQLNPPQKLLSEIMHRQLVEDLSEATGKTVARPSGILGGGIVAFVGTALYYYLTKNYGYTYNYFIFVMLLICGFILGWSLEIILKLKKH